MKRYIILLFTLVAAVSAYCQHMKFMGIPLDGSISTFHQKIVNKGFMPLTSFNKNSGPGVRGFNGTFWGNEADVYVYYNAKTKTVYRAKACIVKNSEDIIIQSYEAVKSSLKDKYNTTFDDEGTQDGYETYAFVVVDEEGNGLGTISIYISEYNDIYPVEYTLHIDYIDWTNSEKDKDLKDNDL